MTNEQLLKYFECRPGLKEIYLVGTVVYIDKPSADKYAKQIKGKVDVKGKEALQNAYEKEILNLTELSKEEAEAQLKVLDLTSPVDESKLRQLVKSLGLKPEEDTREAYCAVLTIVQSELNNNGSGEDLDGTGDIPEVAPGSSEGIVVTGDIPEVVPGSGEGIVGTGDILEVVSSSDEDPEGGSDDLGNVDGNSPSGHELTKEEARNMVLTNKWGEDSDYRLMQDLVGILDLNTDGKRTKVAYAEALNNFQA